LISLSFFEDTLYSIQIDHLPPKFEEAFFKKYGKGKLELGTGWAKTFPFTNCRNCELCPTKKIRNYDSSYIYKNGEISTKLTKAGICMHDDDEVWSCICAKYENIEIKNEHISHLIYFLTRVSEQKAKEDSMENHNNEVKKLIDKL